MPKPTVLETHCLRGHPTQWDGLQWTYADTGEPTAGNRRQCGLCMMPDTPEGHDPCIANLPGAMNACCGHGMEDEAYIQFWDGSRVGGIAALRQMSQTHPLAPLNTSPCASSE